jgi:tRNA U34 5-carboxymethylaminomethyl modifying GTPase MnmE/TrmE
MPIDDLNNTSAILGYLKSIRDNTTISNTHLKINIIGEGRIGKTQLFNFFNKKLR